MSHIAVKPHPDLDPKAWPLIVHPASGGLLDANKQVPAEGRPWLHDGFTCRMLTDGAIVRVEAASAPGFTEWAAGQIAAQTASEPEAPPAETDLAR